MLVDEHGIPLSLLVTAANVNDCTQLDALLAARRVQPPGEQEENLCLDAGYTGKAEVAVRHGYIPHIHSRKAEADAKAKHPERKAKRWIVELVHSWINRFKKINPRHEKTDLSFLGLLQLAMSMIVLNKVMIIYG